MTIGWDGRPTQKLAERWEWLEDGAGLRVVLKPGVRFHDGSALTLERALAILRKRLVPEAGLTFSSISSIDIANGAIEIRTRRKEAFLLTDLADVALTSEQSDRIGTGPYALESDAPSIRLRAFDGYHQGAPVIKAVEFKSYQTQRSAWAALMRGEIDALHEVSRDAVEFVEAETTGVGTHSHLRPYYILLGFNLRHPVLRNREVRRAINEAIHREELIERAMHERGEPARSPIWPLHWAYNPTGPIYRSNPDAARLRLQSAGYPLRTAGRVAGMPSRFSFTCLLWADDPRFERLALMVQRQLYDVGIDMQLEAVPGVRLYPRLMKGDFDAYLMEQTSGRSLAWVYRFWHSSQSDVPSLVNTGYSSADRILDRLRGATEDDEIRDAVGALHQQLFADPPAAFLAWGQATRALSRTFSVPDTSGPDILGSLWQWRPVAQAAR
jgi:peptide/nickel transport system substrate-binding protein